MNKIKLDSGFIRIACSHNNAEMSEDNKGGYIKLLISERPASNKNIKRSISI